MKSMIKYPSLAPEGHLKLQWAKKHMPVLNLFRERYKAEKPFSGMRINICLHIEAKTGCLALALKEMGAEVALAGCNPLSTQDDVSAALDELGIHMFGIHGADQKLYDDCIIASLDNKPQLIIDDGGDLVHILHHDKRGLRLCPQQTFSLPVRPLLLPVMDGLDEVLHCVPKLWAPE